MTISVSVCLFVCLSSVSVMFHIKLLPFENSFWPQCSPQEDDKDMFFALFKDLRAARDKPGIMTGQEHQTRP